MTNVRFCTRCRADVEDVGGFCLLGHRFPVTAADDPLADLRAEVDQAFQKVQAEVATALDPVRTSTADLFRSDLPGPEPIAEDEMLEEMQVTSKALWAPLEEDAPVSRNDPIVAFAPSPRMDWGPEGSKLKRKSGRSGVRRSRPNPA